MAEKQFRQVSFSSPEFIDPDCLVPGQVPWVLARHGRVLFPSWLFEGWSRRTGRGRDAWSPLVLVTLLGDAATCHACAHSVACRGRLERGRFTAS